MLSIIKNDWNRLMEQKNHLIISVILTICSVSLAVIITGKVSSKINIAVIGDSNEITALENIRIHHVEEVPKESALMQKEYDAVVCITKQGIEVNSENGDNFNDSLKAYLAGQTKEFVIQSNQRKIGTNILGYLIMFLLMQGVLYARLFAEDKEKHQIERVACSSLPFSKYIAGHGIFIWMLIWIPTFIVIAGIKMIGLSIGFALWQYALLIGVIDFMAVCLALCINSFFYGADNANMVGSYVIMLSSILAGSFYDMSNGNELMAKLLYVLPQKSLMLFIDTWEKHSLNFNALLALIYVIIASVILLIVAVIKTRKTYIYHRS